MTNIQSSRQHIIEQRISVPNNGYIGDLRDLIHHFERNGPTTSRNSDDGARLEADEEWVSLVWTESRQPLPQFEELETFVRWLLDKQRADQDNHADENRPTIDIVTLDYWAKRFRTAPAKEKI